VLLQAKNKKSIVWIFKREEAMSLPFLLSSGLTFEGYAFFEGGQISYEGIRAIRLG
jgi:hypothetical protein